MNDLIKSLWQNARLCGKGRAAGDEFHRHPGCGTGGAYCEFHEYCREDAEEIKKQFDDQLQARFKEVNEARKLRARIIFLENMMSFYKSGTHHWYRKGKNEVRRG